MAAAAAAPRVPPPRVGPSHLLCPLPFQPLLQPKIVFIINTRPFLDGCYHFLALGAAPAALPCHAASDAAASEAGKGPRWVLRGASKHNDAAIPKSSPAWLVLFVPHRLPFPSRTTTPKMHRIARAPSSRSRKENGRPRDTFSRGNASSKTIELGRG